MARNRFCGARTCAVVVKIPIPKLTPMMHDAQAFNKWNRNKLRKVKQGTVVEHHVVSTSVFAPVRCVALQEDKVGVYVKSKVVRIIRSGCWQNVSYSVNPDRCIHESSVKLTRRMLSRARRDNRLWDSGTKPAVVVNEKHIVSPETHVQKPTNTYVIGSSTLIFWIC